MLALPLVALSPHLGSPERPLVSLLLCLYSSSPALPCLVSSLLFCSLSTSHCPLPRGWELPECHLHWRRQFSWHMPMAFRRLILSNCQLVCSPLKGGSEALSACTGDRFFTFQLQQVLLQESALRPGQCSDHQHAYLPSYCYVLESRLVGKTFASDSEERLAHRDASGMEKKKWYRFIFNNALYIQYLQANPYRKGSSHLD